MTPRGTWKFLRARPGRPANKCIYTPYIIWHFIYSHNKAGCIKGLYCPPGGSGSGQKWATASSYVRPPVGLPPAQFIIRRIPPRTPFCSLASGTFCERENRAHQTRASQSSTFTRPFPRDEQEHLQTFSFAKLFRSEPFRDDLQTHCVLLCCQS